jgi:alkylation response protein AidB-like acyl-CoA dehydrogenase
MGHPVYILTAHCIIFQATINDARQMLYLTFTGGNGYVNDYPAGRLLRDAKLYEIGGGTSEIRRLVIGRSLNSEYS